MSHSMAARYASPARNSLAICDLTCIIRLVSLYILYATNAYTFEIGVFGREGRAGRIAGKMAWDDGVCNFTPHIRRRVIHRGHL